MHVYLLTGTTSVTALEAGGGNNNKRVVFKKCVPSTNCINEIDNAKVIV